MIRIIKSARPAILVEKEATWIAELLQAIEDKDEKKAATISHRYAHTQIRETLEKDFHNKCGYCENTINAGSYERIDHFKPQKIAPEDTFNWDNLILSCEICNSSKYKGDKFPMEDNHYVLLHPCIDNPNDHLIFEYLQNDKQALINSTTSRGQTTIAILGLNRLKLKIERNNYLQMIVAICKFAATDKEAKALLEEKKLVNGKFSAFVKTICAYFNL